MAYYEGYQAFFDGVKKDDNPYKTAYYEQEEAWASGWKDAFLYK
jgi:ribosome modulation factor